jgi:hypothetical protein
MNFARARFREPPVRIAGTLQTRPRCKNSASVMFPQRFRARSPGLPQTNTAAFVTRARR